MKGRLLLLAICALAITAAHGDSLNCRLVGNWPFGPSSAIALDSARALAFVGSGGGVYVLDVSNPAQPVKLSEVHTQGMVKRLGLSGTLTVLGTLSSWRQRSEGKRWHNTKPCLPSARYCFVRGRFRLGACLRAAAHRQAL